MDELIARLVADIGIDRAAAEKAVGIILDFLVKEGPADKVQPLLAKRSKPTVVRIPSNLRIVATSVPIPWISVMGYPIDSPRSLKRNVVVVLNARTQTSTQTNCERPGIAAPTSPITLSPAFSRA